MTAEKVISYLLPLTSYLLLLTSHLNASAQVECEDTCSHIHGIDISH